MKGACSKWSWFLGKISLLPLRKVIVRVLCMLWANGVLARNQSALFGTVIVCGLLWRLVSTAALFPRRPSIPSFLAYSTKSSRSWGWRPGNKAIVLQAYWGSFRKLSREGGGEGNIQWDAHRAMEFRGHAPSWQFWSLDPHRSLGKFITHNLWMDYVTGVTASVEQKLKTHLQSFFSDPSLSRLQYHRHVPTTRGSF